MEFRLPERIRHEYDEQGNFRLRRGKRWYPSRMYQEMSFKWVRENLMCPDCGGELRERRWERNRHNDLGNIICQDCGKELTLVSSNIPSLGRVRMPSYLRLLRAIEQQELPDFILLTYDKDSLDIRYLLYLKGAGLTAEFIHPGWRSVADDEHDIWCDIETGRLNAMPGSTALLQLYPEENDQDGE